MRIQPAGVILFARNIKNAGQTWRLLRDCQKCVRTHFLLVSISKRHRRSIPRLLGPAPAPADVFATNDRKLFRNTAKRLGRIAAL